MTQPGENRHQAMLSRLQKRDEERMESSTRRREERRAQQGDSGSGHKAGTFLPKILQEKNAILSHVEDIFQQGQAKFTQQELLHALEEAMNDHERLKKTITESSHVLTSFELEQSRIEMQNLFESLQNLKDQLAPKKKFAFGNKGRSKPATTSTEPAKKPLTSNETAQELVEGISCGLHDETDRKDLHLTSEEVSSRDVTLRRLTRCKVQVGGLSANVFISHLEDCVCICGPAQRSVFVEHCRSCVLVLAGQQIRIHDSQDCTFYVCARSAPIIENCDALQFGPYTMDGEEVMRQLRETQLDAVECGQLRWQEVNDFNHLVRDVPSPHWSILPVDKRETFVLPK